MTQLWLTLLAALLAWRVGRRTGPWSPLPVTLWFLAGVLLVSRYSGLGLASVTPRAGAIVAFGLVGLAAPAFLMRGNGLRVRRIGLAPVDLKVALPRLLISAFVLTALVLIGYVAFRARIADAAGTSFDALTPQQVRAAENGAARGGGILALCTAAAPVLSCLGIWAAQHYSKLWYGATAFSVGMLLESPTRTGVLALGVTSLVFYLYIRPQRRPSNGARGSTRRVRTIVVVVVALIAFIIYFQATGAATHKNEQAALAYPDFHGPSWILIVLLYFTGGLSALSVALERGFDPFEHPNSIYALTKIHNMFDPSVHVPNTIAQWVRIPGPFNVYTGFGQIYFDFGLAGVLILCAFLGWLAVVGHRKAMSGRVEWAFVAAIFANVLASLQLAYRLFLVDVDFQILVGVLVFKFVGSAGRRVVRARKVNATAVASASRLRS